MNETTRSEQACPVCLQHTLAIDEPPRIDVMGIQVLSDIVGMGDLRQDGAVAIVCLACGTRWRDKAAFDRGESEPVVEVADVDVGGPAVDDLEAFEPGADDDEGDDGDGDQDHRA